jgi:SAM-dependent methyltransferase
MEDAVTNLAGKWSDGLGFEIGFWQKWLKTKGGQWHEDFRARLDPQTPLKSEVENAIRDMGTRELDILDVGAGPITCLGYMSEKFDLRITAVDPLADAYAIILREEGLTPPIVTQKCFAEHLLQVFGDRRFHVCFSKNALDHAIDPRAAILAMAQLLHPNGLLYVRVYKNEGESAGYSGLHSWNFDTDESKNFILWRGAEKFNISEDLAEVADCALTDLEGELVFIAYRKDCRVPAQGGSRTSRPSCS